MTFFASCRDETTGRGLESSGEIDHSERLDRLRRTGVLGGSRFDVWRNACVGIVGGGTLGSHLAPEVVRSGARVWVCDFDRVKTENLATQNLQPGGSKVASIIATCDAIEPGRARGAVSDIREVGVGALADLSLIIDASDDPNLALFLTRVSNGLGIPLLRLAVDGSGKTEFGRVLVSHGGHLSPGEQRHSCQCCSMTPEDITRVRPSTPCPGGSGKRHTRDTQPTLATTGLALTVVGIGLLQAQRIVCARAEELAAVLDRQVVIDLDDFMTQSFTLARSDDCVTGHERWPLTRLSQSAETVTLNELAERALTLRPALTPKNVIFEFFGHSLQLAATCPCGEQVIAVGFAGSAPPECSCGGRTSWLNEVSLPGFGFLQARELGIDSVALSLLGTPPEGALIFVSGGELPPVNFLLEPSASELERREETR